MVAVVRRILALLLILCISSSVAAETQSDPHKKARFSTATEKLPVILAGGSSLTLISPSQWRPLAGKLSRYVEDMHLYFRRTFGEIPKLEASIRLMDEESFYQSTGAPRWTNAMYYRGEILIPLSLSEEIDQENLYRSIKHEYTHAVVNALSGTRCPGWLDEGLAQWIEGPANPLLEPALRNWLRKNHPVSLSLLQGGFTRLDTKMVPAAYGQSLFAAKKMISQYGFETLSHYFQLLRSGIDRDDAFHQAFEVKESRFEAQLGSNLKQWAESSEHLHRHGPPA